MDVLTCAVRCPYNLSPLACVEICDASGIAASIVNMVGYVEIGNDGGPGEC